MLNSTNGTISLLEPNGTYPFQVGPIPGWSTVAMNGNVTVSGAPVAVEVPWTIVTYAVTFQETGLPIGTNWTVKLFGTAYESNTSNLTGYAPNGTNVYRIARIPGWRPPNATGTVTVNASPVWVSVNFSRVFYLVTFHESGLPHGTNWSIHFAGVTEYNTSGGPIKYEAPNGTYTYTVGSVPGYTPNVTGSYVLIRGYPKFNPLNFTQNASAYPVQFNEVGLPVGTVWNVTLNGTTLIGNTSTLAFSEPNGTYASLARGGRRVRPHAPCVQRQRLRERSPGLRLDRLLGSHVHPELFGDRIASGRPERRLVRQPQRNLG